MTEYRVTLVPFSKNVLQRRNPRWRLTVTVEAKSKNDARTVALRKTRKYLEDRDVRIARVEEAA
jgi:hypothetical protein